MVAASDCPNDFKLKRDRIAEMLFTCKVTKCFGCDKIELSVPNDDDDVEKIDEKCKSGIEAGGSKDTKESKVNSSRNDDNREMMEMNLNQVSNYSFGEAEALTDEIEEESQLFEEVSRIKEILDNSEDESDSLLFNSLRRLQLMPLSVETLKATEIGKSVNALRKHGSKDIRNLVRILIEDWKVMVDEWAAATAAIAAAEVATESVKTSVVEEEEGLPSPPMDEGAFFATPASMELSQFFDGMDDDGNPRNSGEFNKNRENGRKPRTEKPNIPKMKHQVTCDSSTPSEDRKAEQKKNPEAVMKKQASLIKPNKSLTGESGPGRPKSNVERRVNNEIKVQRKPDNSAVQRRSLPPQQDKPRCGNDESSVRAKLEAAKRKLQERYQEAENAKKQRTIQVVGLHDLPKQNLARKNQQTRPGNNNNRHWANGRR
ncbi:unnamed protein product [Fraxinus pennsylvanica]|uniref:TFIIS N-terminal domain-containing protein n=1 Tax=Fraxinus pennsylvanica TaxID=56036 RepID=A0AAD2A0W3_9LAMI|nr:unnamed protein product [Fraxinus pennsylvanica]